MMNFFELLSRRENEVTNLLLKGMSNKQIAFTLGISERTIEFHLNNVYRKLQVASRVELILKLGEVTGSDFANPVESTVDAESEEVHNDSQPIERRWAKSLRNTVSLIKQETAMTIRISFEDLENYLRSHPIFFSLLIFLTVSLTTRYVVFGIGLYFWVSYALLGLVLGIGSVAFGMSWRKLTSDGRQLCPLFIIFISALLPLLVAGFDQLYLNTILRYTEPISTTIANISASAAWLTSPTGNFYRATHLSVTSEILWGIASAYMLVLFSFSRIGGKRSGKDTVVSA